MFEMFNKSAITVDLILVSSGESQARLGLRFTSSSHGLSSWSSIMSKPKS